jgi:hypothetical protein
MHPSSPGWRYRWKPTSRARQAAIVVLRLMARSQRAESCFPPLGSGYHRRCCEYSFADRNLTWAQWRMGLKVSSGVPFDVKKCVINTHTGWVCIDSRQFSVQIRAGVKLGFGERSLPDTWIYALRGPYAIGVWEGSPHNWPCKGSVSLEGVSALLNSTGPRDARYY